MKHVIGYQCEDTAFGAYLERLIGDDDRMEGIDAMPLAQPFPDRQPFCWVIQASVMTQEHDRIVDALVRQAPQITLLIVCCEVDAHRMARWSQAAHLVWYDQAAAEVARAEEFKRTVESVLDHHMYTEMLKIKSLHASLSDAVGSVAHQWRQPLSLISTEAINISLNARMKTLIEAEVVEGCDVIMQQAQKMSKIMTSFLNVSKITRYRELFSVAKMCQAIYGCLAGQLRTGGIVLTVSCDQDASLYGCQNDLEEVIFNLIANARDAHQGRTKTTMQKHIGLAVECSHTAVMIRVEDNAGGVPAELRTKIFNPYCSTKKNSEGFGIGLYIAKTIVERDFSGTLSLDITAEGSVFTIELPQEVGTTTKTIR